MLVILYIDITGEDILSRIDNEQSDEDEDCSEDDDEEEEFDETAEQTIWCL